MKVLKWVPLLLMVVGIVAPLAAGGTFNRDLFMKFLDMRVGTGEPVYWYNVGEVYSSPDGKLLMRIEGCDMARRVKPADQPDTYLQLSRKTYVYRDPTTNEILQQWEGRPVPPIAYPYQYIVFKLVGDRMEITVEQGQGANLRTIGPTEHMLARQIGDTAIFSSPLFINMETPQGHYEAYENYDYILLPPKAGVEHRYQMTWNRYAAKPSFIGPGKVQMQMVGWRVDRFEDLPATIRDYIRAEAPLYMAPPKDLNEIRALQK